jgi:branched-chain amino acid transport system permease protein
VFIAIGFLIATNLFLSRSYLGKALRAVADNPFGSRIVGLKVKFLYIISVAIGGLLAGAAGTLMVTFSTITPPRAFDFSVFSFLIIALGGLGSYFGAVIGGLIFGLVFSLAQGSIISTYAEAFLYGVMLFVIFLKPAGLFGKLG